MGGGLISPGSWHDPGPMPRIFFSFLFFSIYSFVFSIQFCVLYSILFVFSIQFFFHFCFPLYFMFLLIYLGTFYFCVLHSQFDGTTYSNRHKNILHNSNRRA